MLVRGTAQHGNAWQSMPYIGALLLQQSTRTNPCKAQPTHCAWSAADRIRIVGACINYIALDGSQFNRFNGLLFSLESHLSSHLPGWAADQSRACIAAVTS